MRYFLAILACVAVVATYSAMGACVVGWCGLGRGGITVFLVLTMPIFFTVIVWIWHDITVAPSPHTATTADDSSEGSPEVEK